MNKRQKPFFWLILTLLIFGLFSWLFGVAMPEIALEFSIGITIVLITALFTGRTLSLIWLRTNRQTNPTPAIPFLLAFILLGCVAIAFLLNEMIEKTTLFPFAVTVLLVFLTAAATGALVTVIRHQYKTKVEVAHAVAAQSKSELQLLQSQLSPHFLFNTLNNLYGLSLTDPGKVPPLLLKLSELLRYSVYDVKEMLAPLQHEVDYIKNYIEFEKIRLGPRLSLNVEIDPFFNPQCKIPPMLLIVFVENAFKHSRNTLGEKIQIDINLHNRRDSIVFSARNSCSATTERSERTEKHSGFGLDNVRKRLDLLYPDKHELQIVRSDTEYSVHLILPCQ